MKLPIFQIDAFTNQLFRGNPAAVCPLSSWLSDDLMQQIAAENNLSETAFFVKNGNTYDLRWFTPNTEVDLCGHATLATAYVLYSELGERSNPIVFNTRSGTLRVHTSEAQMTLDFPSQPPTTCKVPQQLLPALGLDTADVFASQDYFVVIESEDKVRSLSPDFSKLLGLPLRGVIVTSIGKDYDFVSRWFGPNVAVNEDPVTGSAHCALVPFWASRLNKTSLKAAQLSARGGEVLCRLEGSRVFLTGSAVCYLKGEIEVNSEV